MTSPSTPYLGHHGHTCYGAMPGIISGLQTRKPWDLCLAALASSSRVQLQDPYSRRQSLGNCTGAA